MYHTTDVLGTRTADKHMVKVIDVDVFCMVHRHHTKPHLNAYILKQITTFTRKVSIVTYIDDPKHIDHRIPHPCRQ